MKYLKHKRLIAFVLVLGIMGCGGFGELVKRSVDSPNKRLALAADTLGATRQSLKDLIDQDALTAEQVDKVEQYDETATKLLSKWETAVENDLTADSISNDFWGVVSELNDIKNQASE